MYGTLNPTKVILESFHPFCCTYKGIYIHIKLDFDSEKCENLMSWFIKLIIVHTVIEYNILCIFSTLSCNLCTNNGKLFHFLANVNFFGKYSIFILWLRHWKCLRKGERWRIFGKWLLLVEIFSFMKLLNSSSVNKSFQLT